MGRVVARDVLYKLIFENLFVEPEDSVSYTNFLTNSELDDENLNYVRSSYVEIIKEKENLLKIIEKSVVNKQGLQGVFRADLAIIILATYEMMFRKIEPKIILNEAIKLAKKYSTDKSYSFVNGVLANIVKDNNLING